MRTAMRVLQVITDRDRRGAQVFALDLQEGLRHLEIVVDTVALARGEHGDLLAIEALGASKRSLSTLRNLRARAREYDVVIAHGSSTLFACSVAFAFTRVPFVYRQISDPLFWAATWPRRLRVAAMIRSAAAIVVLSNGTSAVLRSHYQLGPRRISVIPNAVPRSSFRAADANTRRHARDQFSLPHGGPIIVYVGALAEEKGVDLVVRCTASIPAAHALIVGDGPERVRLEMLAAELAPGRIHFTGSVMDSRSAITAGDLLVLPSRGGDSMPAALIEAGLCGLATVVTPVGAITDVVVDGKTGVVVPIGDLTKFTSAVRDLLDDSDRRIAFGAAAAQRCQQDFTIEATAPRWADLLASITRGSPTARRQP